MKKQFIFLFLSILGFTNYAQITFEKGYYIANSGQKVECLIQNLDWKNNPTEFEYKVTENAPSKKATLQTIKEFGIYNESKFVRYTVQIDKSSDSTSKLSNTKEPIFKIEQLFLKVLLEGKASLFLYEDKNLRRYFYSMDNNEIEQLIYKRFMNPPSLKIHKNNTYRQQLGNNLKCPDISVNTIRDVDYNKNHLIKLFKQYNEYTNSEYTSFIKRRNNKNIFNITIRPGLSSSSLRMENTSRGEMIDFGNKVSFRIGVEAEYVFPFNKRKWALIFEPTYQSYRSERSVTLNKNTLLERMETVKASYNFIEFPLGIRHYFFLSKSSKIFVNSSVVFDLSTDTILDYETIEDLEGETGINFAFGLGYKQNNKYSVEIRYNIPREILGNHFFWESDYKTISVILGYTIF